MRLGLWLAGVALACVVLGGACYGVWRYNRYLQAWQDRKEGLRLAELGQFEEAEPLLKNAVAANANDLEAIKALVVGYQSRSRAADGEEYLTRWCSLEPRDAEPFKRRMGLFQRMGKLPEALADADHILQLEPDNEEIQRQLILVLIQEGRYADVERRCRQELERRPEHPGYRYYEALASYKLGNLDEAQSILDELIAEQPELADPLILRAQIYRARKEDPKAIPLLRKALASNPSRNEARYELAQALLRTGEEEEGNRVMTEFLRRKEIERLLYDVELQPGNLKLQARAAQALLNNGQTEEALRLARKILAADPNYPDARKLQEASPKKTGD
jgi:tetratricopeptide (TPR) repeat protein